MNAIDGTYDIQFLRGEHAVTIGSIQAQNGSLTGRDQRGVQYAGTYQQVGSTGAFSVALTLNVPPATRLADTVTSHPTTTQANVTFQVDASQLAGAPLALPVDLTAVHASGVSLPGVTLRLVRHSA